MRKYLGTASRIGLQVRLWMKLVYKLVTPKFPPILVPSTGAEPIDMCLGDTE